MAPYLDAVEPVDDALDSNLKKKPSLVAPEPEHCVRTVLNNSKLYENMLIQINAISQAQSLRTQAKEMLAPVVQIKRYAHQHPKALIPTSH